MPRPHPIRSTTFKCPEQHTPVRQMNKQYINTHPWPRVGKDSTQIGEKKAVRNHRYLVIMRAKKIGTILTIFSLFGKSAHE